MVESVKPGFENRPAQARDLRDNSAIRLRAAVFAGIAAFCGASVWIASRAPLAHTWRFALDALGILVVIAVGKLLLVDGLESIRSLTEKRNNVLESIPDGLFIVDRDWRFTHVNEQAEKFLRRDARELVGERIQDVLDSPASELVSEMVNVRRQAVPLQRLHYFESTNAWIEIRIQPGRDELLVYLRDVTERKTTERKSHEIERRLRLLLSQLPAVLWTVDLDMRITSVAGAALNNQNLVAEDIVGAPYDALIEDSERKCSEELQRAFAGEAGHFETFQNGRWLRSDVEPMRDAEGVVVGAIGVMLDVTDVRENADRFARLARQDAMTQLPNRLALEERLPVVLKNAKERDESVAVLFVDVDRFKTINDTLGHRIGDELLRCVAARLRHRLENRATIYRPGGDEFVVIMDGIRHKRTVASVAMDVLSAFGEPFSVDGRELFVTASIGTSIFPQNAQTPDELLTFADSAMYRAKEAGRNNAKFYDGTMHAHVLERMGLEQDLRHALARDELRLLFQPIVDVATRRVVAAEALVRWQHPMLGELMPAAFISIAEETGIIVEISRWVLSQACAKAAQLRQSDAPDFHICINLSPRDFYEQDCAATLGAVLAETGLPPNALDIEVTENVMLNDLALSTLNRINALGVRLVVDDFGTGYSSLNYIKRLPIDAIKIDKSFIEDVTRDAYDQGIVKAITTLGQTLGLRIIAEGIESEAQWKFVNSLRCDQAQGYFFSRPLLWSELAALVAGSSKPAEQRKAGRVISLYGIG